MLHNRRPRKKWVGNDALNLKIKFPVAERYLRDSQMPDTMRWYPEYPGPSWVQVPPSWAVQESLTSAGSSSSVACGYIQVYGVKGGHEN